MILVVTDNALLRLDIGDLLAELREVTVAAAASASNALGILAAQAVDCAVIDWDIGREAALAIADALAIRAVPALIISSFGPLLELPGHLPLPVILEKPFSPEALKAEAQALLAVRPANKT